MRDARQRIERIFIRGVFYRAGKILILKNAKNGKYMLPGGIMGEYETVEEVFRKAMKNEIGLEKAKLGNFINMWSFTEEEGKADNYYSVLDFEILTDENSIMIGSKYSESKWIGEEEIEGELMDEGQKRTLQKYFAWLNKK